MSILSFQSVAKSFGKTKALTNISFDVKKGELFALLGPNGAGKTTLINCLNGMTDRDEGLITVMGKDPQKEPNFTKMQLGIVEQELVFDHFFSAIEILRIRRGLFGLKPDDEYLHWILKKLNLTDKTNSEPMGLSGGMKRRLMIAKALAHDPEILILDEPTAGVDIELRKSLYKFFKELKAKGKTIILTTHYLEEAELLADTICIQSKGKTVIVEEKKKLLKMHGNKKLEDIFLELTRE